jgi:transcriptional regulator with XRE-family HTH domain
MRGQISQHTLLRISSIMIRRDELLQLAKGGKMSPRKSPTPTPLGNHIIRRRKAHPGGWTTADLARAAELSYSTVRNIEQGASQKPAEWILRRLINVLECDEGVVFALAGYGKIPERTPEQVLIALDELGDLAPLWRDAIEGIKKDMTPEEQNQAYDVLKAQWDSARNRRRRDHQ